MFAPILAFAGVAAVQAGPLYPRQATSVISSAVSTVVSAPSSVVSSAVSGASSVVESASSAASSAVSSAVESATSAASSGVESVSSAASSAVSSSAAPSDPAVTGNESFPLYPCPTGFLLTYVELNQTVPVPVTQVVQQFGEWANSSYFPNVTASEGGNEVGATHTINLQGVDLIEELVNATMTEESGAARWTWNLTNGPVSAMGVSISNYSTVLSIYDPTFDQTNTIGNSTTLLTYTNFCANSQAEGITLVQALAGLELGTFAASLGGAAPGGAPAPAPSSVSESAAAATSSVASSASSAASSVSSAASSGASSASSAASSALSSGVSAASSAAGVTSSIASAVSSAVSGAVATSTA